MTISARTTIYAGIQMRSRLEAAFAEHLDQTGLKAWGYEGDAYASSEGQYLPDFTTGSRGFHEIKPPNADFDDALQRMHIILASKPDATLIVWTRADLEAPFRIVRLCDRDRGCGRCSRKAWTTVLSDGGAVMDLSEILRWTVDHRLVDQRPKADAKGYQSLLDAVTGESK